MAKTICMLVTNSVENDARVVREATTLTRAGYKVVVIGVREGGTGQPEWIERFLVIRLPYPKRKDLRAEALSLIRRAVPRLYEGLRRIYRSLFLRQDGHALQQTGTPEGQSPPPGSKRGRDRFRTDLLTITLLLRLNLAMAKAAIGSKAEVYHAHDLDTLLAGVLAKIWTGKPLVYDFHELFTEQFRSGTRTAFWHGYFSVLEWILVKRTDARLTVCDHLGKWVSERYGVREVVSLRNVPFLEDPCPGPRQDSRKVILYHGNFFADRGLEQLILVAPLLRGARIVLRGYGYLEPRLRVLVEELGVKEVVSFAPPVPVSELISVAAEADIGVATFIPSCLNTRFSLPNKLFEYMMAGLAVVASDLPEMRRIILAHDIGVLVDPEDPQHLASALNALVADEARLSAMRRNARSAAQKAFNWELESQKLLAVYDRLSPVSGMPDQPGLARDRFGKRHAESLEFWDGVRRG